MLCIKADFAVTNNHSKVSFDIYYNCHPNDGGLLTQNNRVMVQSDDWKPVCLNSLSQISAVSKYSVSFTDYLENL